MYFYSCLVCCGKLQDNESGKSLIGNLASKKFYRTVMIRNVSSLIYSKGPHGFTLLHHANVGEAKALKTYLIEKGLTKTHIKIR